VYLVGSEAIIGAGMLFRCCVRTILSVSDTKFYTLTKVWCIIFVVMVYLITFSIFDVISIE
jgi:hypothetical protein